MRIFSKRCSLMAFVKTDTNVPASFPMEGLSTPNTPPPRLLNRDRIRSDFVNGALTTAFTTSALSSLSTRHFRPKESLSKYSFCRFGIAFLPTTNSVK